MPKSFKSLSSLFLLLLICLSPLTANASWYVGGSVLLHLFPYKPISSNYITLGSSRVSVLSNGISINGGYQFRIKDYYTLATEFDAGNFSDSDGNVTYQGIKHFLSASYYLALKEKLGFYIKPNFMLYGELGLSQNSIGDRVYSTENYYNRKQISLLFGGGLEYRTKRDNKVGLFAEWFYFTPTNMSSYSGGSKPPTGYSLSTYGQILQLGMRYYFE